MMVERKLRVLNMMWLPRATVSPLTNADVWAIRVENVSWHGNAPLPGAPTVVVSETDGQ